MATTTKTPEMAIMGAGARALEAYLGPKCVVMAEKKGTRVVFPIDGVPVYGRNQATTIMVSVPAGNVRFNGSSFRMEHPIGSKDISYTISTGEAFPHPHIFSDGSACMNGGKIPNLVELFAMIADTVTWNNVTADSERYGHFIMNDTVNSMGDDRNGCIRAFKARMAKKVRRVDQPTTEFMMERFPGYAMQALGALR